MEHPMKSLVVLKYSMSDGSLAAEMIMLSGGSFMRVDDAGELVSEVDLSDFSLGRYSITFEQYDRFAKATGRKLPGACGWGRGSRPIVKVSWYDATAYAQCLGVVF
jgi:formylglycine-generating enzyme required for sulfatase activity